MEKGVEKANYSRFEWGLEKRPKYIFPDEDSPRVMLLMAALLCTIGKPDFIKNGTNPYSDPLKRSKLLQDADTILTVDEIARENKLSPHDRIENLENASKMYARLNHPFAAVDCHIRIEEMLLDKPELAQDYPRFYDRVEALWEPDPKRLVDSMVIRRR